MLDRQLACSGLDGTWSMVVILSSKIYSTETTHKPHVAERAATMLPPQCHAWQFADSGLASGNKASTFPSQCVSFALRQQCLEG
jgi:hypothetical protein